MKEVCEPLVNDGAPYRCGRKVKWSMERMSGTCNRPAVRALTKEAWDILRALLVMSAWEE